jgi:hypothetical protein
MLEAKRTLVKSAPELWAEISDPGSLARHLAAFGSIQITQCRPDSLVVWEGERGTGTVRLEPSGFGTRVSVFCETKPGPEDPQPEPEPVRPGFWARMFRRSAGPAATEAPKPEPAVADDKAMGALNDMLEALGKAHHRPFSRV